MIGNSKKILEVKAETTKERQSYNYSSGAKILSLVNTKGIQSTPAMPRGNIDQHKTPQASKVMLEEDILYWRNRYHFR